LWVEVQGIGIRHGKEENLEESGWGKKIKEKSKANKDGELESSGAKAHLFERRFAAVEAPACYRKRLFRKP